MVLLATVNVLYLIGAVILIIFVFFNGLFNAGRFRYTINQKEKSLNEKEIQVVRQEGVIKEKDLFIGKLQSDIQLEAKQLAEVQFTSWKEKELQAHRVVIIEAAIQKAEAMLAEWKIQEGEKIRKDAVKRSMGVNFGKITEHLIPFSTHLEDF